MIRGLHGLFYSSEPEALRAFLRDKLRLPSTDVGEGWLIFDLPEADLGVHPVDGEPGLAGTHDVSFYCDDIQGTVAELTARGVHFKEPVANRGYGSVTYFDMPGGVVVQLYEPRYKKNPRPQARAAGASRSAKARTAARPAKARAKKKKRAPTPLKASKRPRKKKSMGR